MAAGVAGTADVVVSTLATLAPGESPPQALAAKARPMAPRTANRSGRRPGPPGRASVDRALPPLRRGQVKGENTV